MLPEALKNVTEWRTIMEEVGCSATSLAQGTPDADAASKMLRQARVLNLEVRILRTAAKSKQPAKRIAPLITDFTVTEKASAMTLMSDGMRAWLLSTGWVTAQQ